MQNKPKIEATLNVPQQQHPDPEGRMAKSELYRAAKMSMKLFQMIQDGQQLEAWVQAKITKSADYLDSIYHYMEYQAKFGAGASAATVDDITNDLPSQTQEPEEAVEIDESWTYEQKLQALLEAKVKEATKTDKPWTDMSGKKHPGTAVKGDKYTGKEAEKDEKSKKVKESAKPDFLDMDKDGNKKEPMKKAVADKKKNPFGNKKVSEAVKEKEPEGTYSSKRHETDGQRIARLAKEKRQAEKKKEVKEASDTVEKDAEGNVKSWKHEGDWVKSKNKDGRGKVTNLSDKARRKTEKMGKK